MISHSAPISGVATSNKNWIATAGYDNRVILWDAKQNRSITQVNHDHLVNQCDFSQDGTLLVSASSDHTSRIWSIPDMELLTVLRGHSDDVMKASFDPDGKRVATCSYDGTLKIFDLAGICLISCEGHTGLIETFDWSTDGLEITSCGTDGTIRTWCSHTGKLKHLSDGFEFDMDALIYSEGNQFIVGTDEGCIAVYANEKYNTYAAHAAGVKRLVKYKNLLLSLGYDQQAILWNLLPDGKLDKICTGSLPNAVWARSAAFLTSETIIFASFGSTYFSWNWVTKTWFCEAWQPSISLNALAVKDEDVFSIGDSGQLLKNQQPVADMATLCNCICLTSSSCLVAGQSGSVFDIFKQQKIFQHSSSINCCVSYADGGRETIVFGTYDGSLIFLTFQAGTAIEQVDVVKLDCNAIKGIAVRGNEIFCGSADGTLTLVDVAQRTKKGGRCSAHDGILNGVASYQNGFATVSRDRTMRLWDVQGNLKKIVRTRHPKSVKCVASSSNGELTASGSYAGTIDIYDHGVQQWVGTLRRPTMSGISALAWSQYLGRFIASSYDGNCYYV